MNTPDDFEQQLSARAPKRLPAEWRAGILSAAYAERADAVAAAPSHHSRWTLKRVNYSALAAAWVLIGFLALFDLSTESETQLAASCPKGGVPWDHWRQQRRILAEFIDPPIPQSPPDLPSSPIPVPRRSGNRVGANPHFQIA